MSVYLNISHTIRIVWYNMSPKWGLIVDDELKRHSNDEWGFYENIKRVFRT